MCRRFSVFKGIAFVAQGSFKRASVIFLKNDAKFANALISTRDQTLAVH